MARKQKTIHYLYKTTCLVTQRYYIGIHSTNNLDDGYMGSGSGFPKNVKAWPFEVAFEDGTKWKSTFK